METFDLETLNKVIVRVQMYPARPILAKRKSAYISPIVGHVRIWCVEELIIYLGLGISYGQI